MISKLRVQNFRSHQDFSANFCAGATIITGKNGAGKTSLLEAIFIALSGKSWRSNFAEILRENSGDFSNWWRVDLEFSDGEKRIVKFENPQNLANNFDNFAQKNLKNSEDFSRNFNEKNPDKFDEISRKKNAKNSQNFAEKIDEQFDKNYEKNLTNFDKNLGENSQNNYENFAPKIRDRFAKKTFEISGKTFARMPQKFKKPIVFFEPNDLQILYGSPARRRDFFDRFIVEIFPEHRANLNKFTRVLRQRNNLLKSGFATRENLFSWDLQFADLSAKISRARRETLQKINENLGEKYREIAGQNSLKFNEKNSEISQNNFDKFDEKIAQNSEKNPTKILQKNSKSFTENSMKNLEKNREKNYEKMHEKSQKNPTKISQNFNENSREKFDEIHIKFLAGGAENPREIFEKLQNFPTNFPANFGAQKDDFKFFLNKKSAKENASRGENRTILFAVLARQIEILRDKFGEVFAILDDIDSELDDARKANLFKLGALAENNLFATTLKFDGKIANKIEL